MTELWVTLLVIGAWALAAGSVGFVGSLLVQWVRDRQTAKRRVERPVTADSGVAPAPDPALVLVRARGPAFADRALAPATSTAA